MSVDCDKNTYSREAFACIETERSEAAGDLPEAVDVLPPNTARALRARAVFHWFLVASLLPACTQTVSFMEPQKTDIPRNELVIYSPAPAPIMMHKHNQAMGAALDACGISNRVIPVALPESINAINRLDASVKPYHLPIVTTLDFQTAIDATAPDWHGYEAANSDLKFVGSLYDVTFGVMVFDPSIRSPEDLVGKKIAVPARPSAVRWFSEALFEHGWGVLDQVTLVELSPPQVPAAVSNGDVDAITWNIMSETPEGYVALLPMLFANKNARWMDIDSETVMALNAASPFKTELVTAQLDAITAIKSNPEGTASLLSFKQALAAWETTPDEVVTDIAACLSSADLSFGSAAGFKADQFSWPELDPRTIHSGMR